VPRRRSKVFEQIVRYARFKRMQAKAGLNPPYECPWCGKRTMTVMKHEELPLVLVVCEREQLCEVLPLHTTFDPIDYYHFVFDNVHNGRVPRFVFPRPVPRSTYNLWKSHVTLGEVVCEVYEDATSNREGEAVAKEASEDVQM